MTLAAAIEIAIRNHLEEGEVVEAAVDGSASRWNPLTIFGALLAQPYAVALTDRRVLALEISRFSNRDAHVTLEASRSAVRATFRRHWWLYGGGLLSGRTGRLRIVFPGEPPLKLYVDGAFTRDARAIAKALDPTN